MIRRGPQQSLKKTEAVWATWVAKPNTGTPFQERAPHWAETAESESKIQQEFWDKWNGGSREVGRGKGPANLKN